MDIHEDVQGVEGAIGHVPQDDVLIAELTVQENLAFNASSSLGKWTTELNLNELMKSWRNLDCWIFSIYAWAQSSTKSSLVGRGKG